MNSINIKKWRNFPMSELFDIHPTKAYKMTNAFLFDGGKNPVVVNSAYNNGVGGYTTQEPTEKGNIITFSDTVDANTIFYQKDNFVGYPHVQGLYPIGVYKDMWTTERLLFFATIFKKKALTEGFNFGNKFRRDIASTFDIILPVDKNNEPDWAYMDKYIRDLDIVVQNSLNALLMAI